MMTTKKEHRPQRQRAKRLDKPKLTNHIPRTRCSDEVRQLTEANAQKAGLKLGEYVRQMCAYGKVTMRASVVDAVLVKGLTKLGFELGAIGNNLNQLTRKTHIRDQIDHERLEVILTGVERLTKKIDDALMQIIANDP